MPTQAYADMQEIKRLRAALDRRDLDLRDSRALLQRYMQHIIETKGRSYLDRVGLTARDSKALSPTDIVHLKEVEKCVLQSSADGRSPTGTNLTRNLQHMPGVTIPLR
jgi:hypothetical protein